MPTTAALLASLVTSEQQTGVFTVRYTGVNIGFGLGATVAGLIVNTSQPSSFLITYIAQALLWGSYVLILFLIPRRAFLAQPLSKTIQTTQGQPHASIAYLLKDRSFWQVWLIALLFYTIGIAQLPNGFTLYATSPGRIGTQALGLALAMNSLSIIALQFAVLRWMSGRLRTRALALLFVFWAVA